MDKPRIEGALGLAWRPRKNGWAAVWLARQDMAKKGYKPTTRQISVHTNALTDQDEIAITTKCLAFQEDMIKWNGDREAPKVFGGTVRALINAYQTDPACRYQKMRYNGRRHTDALCKRIDAKWGLLKLTDLGARDFDGWYADIRQPKVSGGRERISTAHAAMTVVRMMFSFGAAYEVEKTPRGQISECQRLQGVLAKLKYENGKPREEAMTLRQCEDIIAAAHAAVPPMPSIALAQALQFDLRIRQRDAIGEWIPATEPGISVIPHRRNRKWLRGIRWEEISSTMVLQHPASKTGKVIERDLNLYPMVMAELMKIPVEKRSGPVVISELTGRPWKNNNFRDHWRKIATAAGLPKSTYNMDSRAGGITETIEATGGDLERARKEADHSDQAMTARYSRQKRESNNETAVIVADFRAKNRA
jgi:hypothetical protein